MITGDLSIKFSNYKSFLTLQEIKSIKPLNIIVGRNNIGKSAVLDVFEYLKGDTDRKKFLRQGSNDNLPVVLIKKNFSEDELRRVFPQGHSGGPFGGDYWEFARDNYLNKPVTLKVNETNMTFQELSPEMGGPQRPYRESLEGVMTNPFSDIRVRRLLADRNIIPEGVSNDWKVTVEPDGQGATRAIHNLLTYNEYDATIIENKFVDSFNKIFDPDLKISRISTKYLADNRVEIYLHEFGKQPIALSSSGSGIKTVCLVLLNTIAYPEHYRTKLSDYLFLFEELENNLHAHTIRNLFAYLRDIAINCGCKFFVTTHSSTVIDMFDNDDSAQIFRVYKNSTETKLDLVSKYLDKAQIIDDLGVKGSDLLQSNGIIWVEGPSDRIYINKWIDLISEGKYKEGTHYQCIFYGGRLLANLTSTDPIVSEYISMLKVNKNLAIIIDSDRKNKESRINATKKRIKDEVLAINGLVWVTKGKEIENYIQPELIKSIFGKIPQDYTIYTKADDFNLPHKMNKMSFARDIANLFTYRDLNYEDLKVKMEALLESIKKWNS